MLKCAFLKNGSTNTELNLFLLSSRKRKTNFTEMSSLIFGRQRAKYKNLFRFLIFAISLYHRKWKNFLSPNLSNTYRQIDWKTCIMSKQTTNNNKIKTLDSVEVFSLHPSLQHHSTLKSWKLVFHQSYLQLCHSGPSQCGKN